MARRQLQGKRAIITGASAGIGRCLALELGRRGVQLVVNGRRQDRLTTLVDQIQEEGGRAISVCGDVADPQVRTRLVETCCEEFGGLDIVVNNAGIGAMGPFAEATEERLRRIFEVNFFALAEMMRISIPRLREGNDPIIVNMGSVLGHRAAPLKSEYCASKFAVHGLSDAVRAELVNDGIELLLVSPGTTDSEFFDHALEDTTGRDWKKMGAMRPETVAARTIRAMVKRRHEIILTFGGRIIVWLDRMIPGIANRLVARFGQ